MSYMMESTAGPGDGGALGSLLQRASRGGSTDDFCRELISVALRQTRAAGACLWLARGGKYVRFCKTDLAETLPDDPAQQAAVRYCIEQVLGKRQTVALAPNAVIRTVGQDGEDDPGLTNATRLQFIYVPVMLRNADHGEAEIFAILECWWRAVEPGDWLQRVAANLEQMARAAALFFQLRRAENYHRRFGQLRDALLFEADLCAHEDLGLLATAAVNRLRDILGCDRCVLFALNSSGQLRPVAMSDVDVVDPKGSLVQCQRGLTARTLESDEPLLFRKSAEKEQADGSLADYFYFSQSLEVLAIPLKNRRGTNIGVILVESERSQLITPDLQELAISLCRPLGFAVGGILDLESSWIQRTAVQWSRARLTGPEPERRLRRRRKWLITGIIVLAALAPLPFSITADCYLTPLHKAYAVAETAGRVVEVMVAEGDAVEQGQTVARLDDEEVVHQLEILRVEALKRRTELARLIGSGDESAARVAELELQRVNRQIDLIQARLRKTEITAPLDGRVLTRRPADRLGDVLQRGDVFCQIGDTGEWEVLLAVREADVARLQREVEAAGSLPFRFVLRSHPEQVWHSAIEGVSAIGQQADSSGSDNTFVVRAPAPADYAGFFRDGYTGMAKIRVGRRPAVYLATRKLVDFLRVRFF